MSARRVVFALACTLLVQLPVFAAKPATDLSGFWNLSREKVKPDPDLMRRVAPNTVVLEDTGAAEFGTLEFGGLKLKPDALAQAKEWKPADDMTISNACRIPSIVYAMQGPFPIEIFQGTELIVLRLEYFDMARVIFMDGRPDRPKDAAHTKVGFSRGRWVGNVLEVETTHLKEATITNNGLEHSRSIKVIERFKLSPDGKQLWATQEFEDPEVLDNRGVRFIVWTRQAGDNVHAYDCDPAFAEEYNKK
ncbi:MAG: hypothetical protein ABW136_07735 [Steroidobacteraceae bacterium]